MIPLDICRGYYFKGDIIFNKGTENELKASPSLLINDELCIDNSGELLWFPEPNFQTEGEKGTLDMLNVFGLLIKVRCLNLFVNFVFLLPI